ncbi:sensor histidine kinase [Paenibacillus alkalitolerans]|uniref:sensor histidine kinase n=1 Tax=Paenibacillus alkalitolerans TaxID=2799335 RepID=UPI0018F4DFE8|nr:GHKL domain-containing protein [Paenibacillus alkalitolerans]
MDGKRLTFIFIILLVSVLCINNAVNYISTKRELTNNLLEQTQNISSQIEAGIVRSQQAYHYVDLLTANNLRTAAIAVKYALPSRYEEVTNEQLAYLSEQLGVSDITLFAQLQDDVVSVRSSDKKELGLSTKGWEHYYDAYLQLFETQNVSNPSYGQSLPNYWAGEIAPSASNLEESKNKYGYYYDGSTDYLINPYVTSKYILELEHYTGVEKILQDTILKQDQIMEISIFNPLTFSVPDDQLVNVRQGVEIPQYVNRKILFGTYSLPLRGDAEHIQKTFAENRTIHALDSLNGKQVMRSFHAVNDTTLGSPYVIGITTDYSLIQEKLENQLERYVLMSLIALFLSFLIIWFFYRYVNKTRDDVAQELQDNYNEEIQSLFVAVRGQRHDFCNHLNTMKAMMDRNRQEQLHQYISELVQETVEMNDIVGIGHPAIAATISSKLTQALHRKISFTYDFDGMSRLNGIQGVKSVDLVKILGNLIDNAFDEVELLDAEERNVHVHGRLEGTCILFTVVNSLQRELTKERLEKMFQPHYTTKSGHHQGIGLSIVNEKIKQYRGNIIVSTPRRKTIEFRVSVPIHT